jgi:hypothetical protein
LFFSDLVKDGNNAYQMLCELVDDERPADENEWREFKEAGRFTVTLGTGEKQEKEARQKNLKEIWSKALSAFANSGGGVLIWGIKASDRYAEELSLAHDAEALAKTLNCLAPDAVEPPLRGVRVQAFTDGSASAAGLVVCLIPEGHLKAYRARFAGNEFYIRLQDSSKPCPLALLRQLFYPQFTPALSANFKIEVNGPESGRIFFGVTLEIVNSGVVTARELEVEYRATCHLFSIQQFAYDKPKLWSNLDGGIPRGGLQIPLHPGRSVSFGRYYGFWSADAFPPQVDDITLRSCIYGLNMQPISFTAVVPTKSIWNALEDRKSLTVPGIRD